MSNNKLTRVFGRVSIDVCFESTINVIMVKSYIYINIMLKINQNNNSNNNERGASILLFFSLS